MIINLISARKLFVTLYNFLEFNNINLDIQSNTALMHNNIKINSVTRSTQYSKVFAAHEVYIYVYVIY